MSLSKFPKTWFKMRSILIRYFPIGTKIKKQKLGGISITVGPNTNPQFPFVLLDRALLYFQHVSNWAHARSKPNEDQDKALTIPPDESGFTSKWTKQQRDLCAQFIKTINDDAPYEKQAEAERECRKMLEETLFMISSAAPAPAEGKGPL